MFNGCQRDGMVLLEDADRTYSCLPCFTPRDSASEGLVATRLATKTRRISSEPVKQPIRGTGVSVCSPGDLVRVQLFHSVATAPSTLLLRAERCDRQRGIVFGTIVGNSFGLSKALNGGARLAVASHLVCENLQIVRSRG